MENTRLDNSSEGLTIRTSIAPWLSVQNGAKAVKFYKSAFDAMEVYRLEIPDGGLVVRFSVDGAEFWVSSESPDLQNVHTEDLKGSAVRMILTVSDPDVIFAQALKAGATQVFAVDEQHGWRLGRLVDPFGHHWEIGHPLHT